MKEKELPATELDTQGGQSKETRGVYKPEPPDRVPHPVEYMENSAEWHMPMAIAIPKKQTAILLPLNDWTRIKKHIKNIPTQSSNYSSWGFAFIGVFVSSMLALPVFSTIENLKVWIWNGTWVICGASLLVAIFCFILDGFKKKATIHSVDQIIDELDEIDSAYVNL